MDQAEIIKQIRDKVDRDTELGVRPIRKKGFYRAVKRKEKWALIEFKQKQMLNKLNKKLFNNTIKYIQNPNPFGKFF